MNKKVKVLVVCTALSMSFLPSAALSADFIEGGNVPSFDNPLLPSLGILPSEVSTVSGSLSGTCMAIDDCNPATDANSQDNFTFEIPTGYILSGLGVSFNQTSGPANLFGSFALYDETFSTHYLFEPLIASGTAFSTALNLGAGRYSAAFFGQRADDVGNYTLDYSHTLTLSPVQTGAVPEPTTWAMLITGFGFVGSALRRRKAHSPVIA